MTTQELDAELAVLNRAVAEAVAAREAWMDAHIEAYTKFRVGDEIYDLSTGEKLGRVVALRRSGGGPLCTVDCMYVYLEYEVRPGLFDNTSRQRGLSYGSKDDLAQVLRWRLSSLQQEGT